MKVSRFRVRIVTGTIGTDAPPRFCFNGHVMAFEEGSGGTAAGETFEGAFEPNSFAHRLTIEGPPEGKWELKAIDVTYEMDGEEPYEVRLGGVTLDAETSVNIWRTRPVKTFDV